MAARTLAQFAKDKRKKDCPVCQLSDDVRDQIREASQLRIRRPDVVEWLAEDHGASVTVADLETHTNGRHE